MKELGYLISNCKLSISLPKWIIFTNFPLHSASLLSACVDFICKHSQGIQFFFKNFGSSTSFWQAHVKKTSEEMLESTLIHPLRTLFNFKKKVQLCWSCKTLKLSISDWLAIHCKFKNLWRLRPSMCWSALLDWCHLIKLSHIKLQQSLTPRVTQEI